ncbi:MAG: PaaI family thioesterase [Deltaproteobacteria bacterium]|nr:MAG: PaaI family thioesterase [Deltaproteobacteria bacterium]
MWYLWDLMERLPSYGRCFLCGGGNPKGLRLKLFLEGDLVVTEFRLEEAFIGYEGIIHGGILAGILDEVMWWAAAWHSGRACFTTDMTVRYKKPALLEHPFRAIGKVTRIGPRLIETEGEIRDLEAGHVCTVATGRYFLLRGERNREALKLLDYTECSERVRKRFLGNRDP